MRREAGKQGQRRKIEKAVSRAGLGWIEEQREGEGRVRRRGLLARGDKRRITRILHSLRRKFKDLKITTGMSLEEKEVS